MNIDPTSMSVVDDEPIGLPAAQPERPCPYPHPEEAALTVEFQPSWSSQAGAAAPFHEPESAELEAHAEPEESAEFQQPRPEPVVIGTTPRLTSDPRGLPGERFKVPDTVLDGADLPGLAIRGASLRGDEHRYFGITRQDAMSLWHVADGQTQAYLACVADGVGSEPLSQYGSSQVCELARDEVQRRLSALFRAKPDRGLCELCTDLTADLGEQLAARADSLDVPARELSTTLVAAVVEAQSADQERRRCVVFAIGDSPAFLLRAGMFIPVLADQHDTEITSTATSALPTAVGQVAAVSGELAAGDVLMICTDGLANPMRNQATVDQLAAWWGGDDVPSLPEFGWQLSFRAKSYGDDRTAVCFWNR
jgi:serine/threonine protein phosphatase PrpC